MCVCVSVQVDCCRDVSMGPLSSAVEVQVAPVLWCSLCATPHSCFPFEELVRDRRDRDRSSAAECFHGRSWAGPSHWYRGGHGGLLLCARVLIQVIGTVIVIETVIETAIVGTGAVTTDASLIPIIANDLSKHGSSF